MTSIEEADAWIGRTAVDNTGEQIGLITQIWVDDDSGQPEWASVRIPALRGREALVPLAGATAFGGGRRFAFSKDDIVDAPHGALDGRLEVEDKERLASYYGAPDTDPTREGGTWVGRAEDAADGATVRDIGALRGAGNPAPAPQAPAPQDPASRDAGRRFGRKSQPSAARSSRDAGRRFGRKSQAAAPKAKRLFGRKSAPTDQQPAELDAELDATSVGH